MLDFERGGRHCATAMTTAEPLPLPAPETDPWTVALMLAPAAASLGYAVQISNGNLAPWALFCVTAPLAFGLLAILRFRRKFVEHWADKVPMGVLEFCARSELLFAAHDDSGHLPTAQP